MDIQSLQMLKAVADSGSFSAAARQLNFAQSHVSTQILHLEQEIGMPLFNRHNRGISLTSAGETFLKYANEMTRIMDAASKAVAESGAPSGKLRIASMQTTAQTLLPDILSRYHQSYPAVRLEIRTGTSDKNLRAVLDYDADLAFAAGKCERSDLVTVPVTSEHLVLLSSEQNSAPVGAKELEDETLLVFPEGCAYRRQLEGWLSAEGVIAENVIVFDSLPAILASVCAGLGVALLPENAAAEHLKSRRIAAREIPQPYGSLPLNLVYRSDQYPSPALRKLVELVTSA